MLDDLENVVQHIVYVIYSYRNVTIELQHAECCYVPCPLKPYLAVAHHGGFTTMIWILFLVVMGATLTKSTSQAR